MKSDRNKRLGRESINRARVLCASNDKPLWTPFEFVAVDCFKDKNRKTFTEAMEAINAKLIVNFAIYKMMGE